MSNSRTTRAWLGRASATCALALGFGAQVHAEQVFTVNSTLDQIDDDVSDGVCHTAAGTCTLRAAIMQANRTSGVGATIQLPAGIYTLTRPRTANGGELNGDLNLTAPAGGNPVIRIIGAGRITTFIDAAQIDRVLQVAAGRTASIKGITIRNGYTLDSGGGILNSGSLTLEDVTVTGNYAQSSGGGIDVNYPATLVIRNSTLASNTSNYAGGIDSRGSNLSIEDSIITRNSVSAWGGGIRASGPTRISRSAVTFNTAGIGAGLFIDYGATIVNSTIAANIAARDGGGIYNKTVGSSNIYNSTIAYNGCYDVPSPDFFGSGGGIFNLSDGGEINLRNTMVAKNYTSGVPVPDDCYGDRIYSRGRNLFGDASNCSITTTSGSWGLLTPGSLGDLGDHGGPTPTVDLRAGSNAIDAATLNGGCVDENGPLTADQRGFPRTGPCDVGAFEYGAIDPDRIFHNGFE